MNNELEQLVEQLTVEAILDPAEIPHGKWYMEYVFWDAADAKVFNNGIRTKNECFEPNLTRVFDDVVKELVKQGLLRKKTARKLFTELGYVPGIPTWVDHDSKIDLDYLMKPAPLEILASQADNE